MIGINKDGEEAVLAWQFGGESSGKLAAMAMSETRQCQGCPAHEMAAGMRAALIRRR
jgi:hypothetical protein